MPKLDFKIGEHVYIKPPLGVNWYEGVIDEVLPAYKYKVTYEKDWRGHRLDIQDRIVSGYGIYRTKRDLFNACYDHCKTLQFYYEEKACKFSDLILEEERKEK